MKQKNYNIPTVVYFVVTALLIAYFFPREGKFRYQFYEGKPWRYGLRPERFPDLQDRRRGKSGERQRTP